MLENVQAHGHFSLIVAEDIHFVKTFTFKLLHIIPHLTCTPLVQQGKKKAAPCDKVATA